MDFVVILIGFLFVRCVELENPQNNTTPRNSSRDEDRTLTMDDFIIITLNQYAALNAKGQIFMKGLFAPGALWFVDTNGTNYLIVRKTEKQKRDEWKNALDTQNGSDLVCVEDVCLPRDIAEENVDLLETFLKGGIYAQVIPHFAGMVTVFILIGIVGITGNLLIIFVVLKSNTSRNSTNTFLSSLAFADVMVLGFGLPLQVVDTFFPTYSLVSKGFCSLWVFIKYFSIVISVLTMSVMAFERYIAVCHPLKAKTYCTVKNARIVILFLWPLTIGLCYPVTLFLIDDPEDMRCFFRFDSKSSTVAFHAVYAAVVFLMPLCVMLPFYLKIFNTLWQSTKESQKLSGSSGNNSDNTVKVRLQVVKMLVIVLVMFVVCWGPTVVYELVESIRDLLGLKKHELKDLFIKVGLSTLGICNSFVNPLVYASMSKQFQSFLKTICCPTHIAPKTLSAPSIEGSKTFSTNVNEEVLRDKTPLPNNH